MIVVLERAFINIYIVLLGVVLFDGLHRVVFTRPDGPLEGGEMPHSHSAAAKLRRFHRALERGYLRPGVVGYKHVLTLSTFAPAVRTVAKAMEVHAILDAASGTPHHHLSASALASIC